MGTDGVPYPTLRRMLADGLIERIDEPVTSKRKTNRYRITDAGRGVLIQWLTTPVMQKPVRNAIEKNTEVKLSAITQ